MTFSGIELYRQLPLFIRRDFCCFERIKSYDPNIIKIDNPNGLINNKSICTICKNHIPKNKININVAKIWKEYKFFCSDTCYNKWLKDFN